MTTLSVLDAVARAALDTTGGADAWVLVPGVDGLLVAAAAGGCAAALSGRLLPTASGTAALALSSGQPSAMRVSGDGVVDEGLVGLLGRRPTSILSIPCEADDRPVAVLEVVDSQAGAFGIDDVEIVSALGSIVAASVEAQPPQRLVAPADAARRSRSAEASARLEALASADPARFERVVAVLEILVADGS